MPRARRQATPPPAERRTAEQLHSAAIHLLRRLRVEDRATGLTGPRASALSVIVFGGPITMTALAAAEQVRPPSMTRLVQELARDGLVEVVPDPEDGRVRRILATARGRTLLEEGRDRRVARLTEALASLRPRERRLLGTAAELLERLARPGEPARRP